MTLNGEKTGPEFTVRSATVHDIEGLVRFNAEVFRPAVGIWARELLEGRHPTVGISDFCVVESPDGEILSSMCIIPQVWRVGTVRIRVGQVELVGTSSRWRGRGFIRAQMEWFGSRLRHHECLLACVRGAPTMYQHLGYQFAVAMKGGVKAPLAALPEDSGDERVQVRLARPQDIGPLCSLYHDSQECLDVCSMRTEAVWQYQDSHSTGAEHAYETWVLERSGKIIGYLRASLMEIDGSLVVRELAYKHERDVKLLFALARRRAIEQSRAYVLFQLPSSNPSLSLLVANGAEFVRPWAWQVRVPNWKEFLLALRPVFRDRLSRYGYSRLTADVRLVLSERRTSLRLVFEEGSLTEVLIEPEGAVWQARLTDSTLTMLALGFRSREAIEDWHLETQVAAVARPIMDVLFPRMTGYVYEPY